MIDLRNVINRKKIPENENLKQVVDIVKKIIDFNKQQNSKWSKMLTAKQMLQRFPITVAQVKAGNTSENLLIETRQVYILCIEKNNLLNKYTKIQWIQ